MPTATGIAKQVFFKKETTFGTLPTASGATTVRRTSADFNLTKDTYQSDEIRTDFQIADWDITDAEARKRGEQTGLDTLVVHALNDEH